MLVPRNFVHHTKGTINRELVDVYLFVGPTSRKLRCLVSTAGDWEHVSICVIVGAKRRTPNWDEMCFVKNKFWAEDQCVMQLHPPKDDYINFHKNVLHLWRPLKIDIPPT